MKRIFLFIAWACCFGMEEEGSLSLTERLDRVRLSRSSSGLSRSSGSSSLARSGDSLNLSGSSGHLRDSGASASPVITRSSGRDLIASADTGDSNEGNVDPRYFSRAWEMANTDLVIRILAKARNEKGMIIDINKVRTRIGEPLLYDAMKRNNFYLLRLLEHEGASLDADVGDGMTCRQWVAKHGDPKILQLFSPFRYEPTIEGEGAALPDDEFGRYQAFRPFVRLWASVTR